MDTSERQGPPPDQCSAIVTPLPTHRVDRDGLVEHEQVLSARSSHSSKQEFKDQLQEQVAAARHGHRGLEVALDLICERLLDLEECSGRIEKKQKTSEAKYHQLRQERIEHEQGLSTITALRDGLSKLPDDMNDVRQKLLALTSRVDGIDVVAKGVDGVSGQGASSLHDELAKLKRKVDMVAANVMGDADELENDQQGLSDLLMGVHGHTHTGAPKEHNKLDAQPPSDIDKVVDAADWRQNILPAEDDEIKKEKAPPINVGAGSRRSRGQETTTGGRQEELDNHSRHVDVVRELEEEVPDVLVGIEKRTEDPNGSEPSAKRGGDESLTVVRDDDIEDDAEGKTLEGGQPSQPGGDQTEFDDGNGLSPRRARARMRWTKIKMYRAFLVKKSRRQAMAERKVKQSETVVTRVERLEQALGVNAYTKGAGRLDTLARDARLSIAMLVEHQARAASDALAAPMCLLPAHGEDGSTHLNAPSKRGREQEYRTEHGQSLRAARIGRGSASHGEDSGEGTEAANNGELPDVRVLWMEEDARHLCEKLLLERTLDELAEGLAFAASHVEQLANDTSAFTLVGSLVEASKPSETLESRAELRAELERMRHNCESLASLVAAASPQVNCDVSNNGERPSPKAPRRTDAVGILRLTRTLAGNVQHLLSRQEHCRILDAFSFTPERKCLCGREFDHFIGRRSGGMLARSPISSQRPIVVGRSETKAGAATVGRDTGSSASDLPSPRKRRRSVVITLDIGGDDRKEQAGTTVATPVTSSTHSSSAENGTTVHRPRERGHVEGRDDRGFGVRPTLYQSLVLSLNHLASFLAAVRSHAAHRAVTSMHLGVSAAENAARTAAAVARAAEVAAQHASAEAMSAAAGAAEATASARNEGSIMLEELHRQLAAAMENERLRVEQDNDARAGAERERVGRVLEERLGHLMSLLDTKAGQEDVSAISRAMGDVKESLASVTGSLPGDTSNVITDLQEALSQKADKRHTKRQMSLLVARVADLLRDDTDNPSLATKKCLSCDRMFNKASFRELAQQLPHVIDAVDDQGTGGDDGHVAYQPSSLVLCTGNSLTSMARSPVRNAGVVWNGAGSSSPGERGTRPGSAPSRSRSAIDLRSHKLMDRPSSARVTQGGVLAQRWSSGAPKVTTVGRPISAASRLRARVPTSTASPSQLLPPTALSASMNILARGFREVVDAEVARAKRAVALEPVPAPDHLRYGGMTAAPLVRQLFANIGPKHPTAGIINGGKQPPGGSGNGRGAENRLPSSILSRNPARNVQANVGGVGGNGRAGGLTKKGKQRQTRGNSPHSVPSDEFLSTLEYHKRNVVNVDVRVPPLGVVVPLDASKRSRQDLGTGGA